LNPSNQIVSSEFTEDHQLLPIFSAVKTFVAASIQEILIYEAIIEPILAFTLGGSVPCVTLHCAIASTKAISNINIYCWNKEYLGI